MIGKNFVAYLSKLFILLLLFWTVNASAEIITLVTGDFAPFSGKNLPQGGMTTEIIVKAFNEVGKKTDIKFRPWKRGYHKTLDHTFFGTFPYVADDKRKKEFLFSEPIYTVKYIFFGRDSNIKYEKDEDLKGLKVCLPQGYSLSGHQRLLDQKIIRISVRPRDDAACFKLIKIGRADLVLMNQISGWAVIEKTFGTRKGFRTIGKPRAGDYNYYMIVDKSYPNGKKLLELFNKGLQSLKQKGIYQEIIERHLGK